MACPLPGCPPSRYAFGITLWELYTSQRPFRGVNAAHLGYQISQGGLRPEFPREAPPRYSDLAERCWEQAPTQRWGPVAA